MGGGGGVRHRWGLCTRNDKRKSVRLSGRRLHVVSRLHSVCVVLHNCYCDCRLFNLIFINRVLLREAPFGNVLFSYGPVSAGRQLWLFYVFFFKEEPLCDQT